MFDTLYNYLPKGNRKGELGKTVHLFAFRTPRKRQIIVEIHEHDSQPIAIVKFFDKAHRLSEKRFSLMNKRFKLNEDEKIELEKDAREAAPIIRTAIQIMLDFYKRNPFLSFAFMGAPDEDGNADNNKRFRVYSGVMKRLFSDVEFEHLQRQDRSSYILLNRSYCYKQPHAAGEIFKLLETAYPDEFDLSKE